MKGSGISRKEIWAVVFIALVSSAVISALIFSGFELTRLAGKNGHWYTLWYGSRAILFDQTDPYDANIRLQVQNLVYGRPAGQNEDPYLLDVPFHILELFFPFAFISDVNIAFLAYMILCELLFLGFLLIHTQLIKLSLSPLLFGFGLILLFLNFYTIEAFRFVSAAIPLGFACAAILWTLESGRDELAGGLLAISAFRFEMTGLFLILIVLNVVDKKNWRVLAGFIMTTVVLVFISLFIFPNWFLVYWRQFSDSIQSEYGFLIKITLHGFTSEYGTRASWGISVLGILLVVYEWYLSRSGTAYRFYWVSCLALAVTPLLGLRVDLNELFILIPGWLLILFTIQERWQGAGAGLFILLCILFVFIPWAVYLGWLFPIGSYDVVLYLFIPITNIVGLYWIRWWVVNPPRTFLDVKGSPK